jgi:phosphatidate cytidylyltransferase
MALNIQTFKTRSLTAAIFVIVMLAGLLVNQWSFFILFSVIHFGCWIEYQKLVALIDPGYKEITPFHKYGVVLAGWCIMLYCTNDSFQFFGIRLPAIGWWLGIIFVFVMPIVEILFARQLELKNIAHSAFGLVYISLSLGLMMSLRCHGMILKGATTYMDFFGFALPLMLILSIWINDTMAYVVGSLIGKTPFSKISPKKTWEGTAGGAILCVAVMGLLGWWFKTYTVIDWIVIAAIAAVMGTIGDLFESKLKRLANVKDSGSIMPGHGGFLDRFDSLLFAIPFVWLYVTFFMK